MHEEINAFDIKLIGFFRLAHGLTLRKLSTEKNLKAIENLLRQLEGPSCVFVGARLRDFKVKPSVEKPAKLIHRF